MKKAPASALLTFADAKTRYQSASIARGEYARELIESWRALDCAPFNWDHIPCQIENAVSDLRDMLAREDDTLCRVHLNWSLGFYELKLADAICTPPEAATSDTLPSDIIAAEITQAFGTVAQ